MQKARFTETQIITILKEAESGMLVKEVCRKHGISDATYYNWKSKYGGLAASDLKRLKEMEAEMSRLKRMYTDLTHENRALKDLIEKSSEAVREKRSCLLSHCRAQALDSAQLPLCRPCSCGFLPIFRQC